MLNVYSIPLVKFKEGLAIPFIIYVLEPEFIILKISDGVEVGVGVTVGVLVGVGVGCGVGVNVG